MNSDGPFGFLNLLGLWPTVAAYIVPISLALASAILLVGGSVLGQAMARGGGNRRAQHR